MKGAKMGGKVASDNIHDLVVKIFGIVGTYYEKANAVEIEKEINRFIGDSYFVCLKKELINQWCFNHSEHCGYEIYPCSNPDGCQWPVPKIIQPNEVCSLLS
jgi:hypothetical protein